MLQAPDISYDVFSKVNGKCFSELSDHLETEFISLEGHAEVIQSGINKLTKKLSLAKELQRWVLKLESSEGTQLGRFNYREILTDIFTCLLDFNFKQSKLTRLN